jgi:nitrous oxidase accessory protein NosD
MLPPARAATVRVGLDPVACPGAGFTSIQGALDAAAPGTLIVVCAGTYAEQLTIAKPVRLRGLPGAVVRPIGMVANTTSLRTGRAVAAVAVVGAKASLDRLEFDASENRLTGCGVAPLLMGVFFRGASGTLRNSRVRGVQLGPEERACETGAAVAVQGDGATPVNVKVSGNTIFDYQRAGVLVNEVGARARVRANVVVGAGPTPDLAQNGIQVGFGAVARVEENVVQDNVVPSSAACTFDGGNLFFAANGGIIARNLFAGNTVGVVVTGDRNRIVANAVDGFLAGLAAGLDGIAVYGDGNVVRANRVVNTSEVGIRLAGDQNRAVRNVVVGTRAAHLCETTRALPGCGGQLSVCGVGLWVAGAGNTLGRNTFVDNDLDVRDDGPGGLVAPVRRPWAP